MFTGLILFLGVSHPASAQLLSFDLKETLPIESVGFNTLAGVSDMDGDGALEAVIWQFGASSLRVVERQDTGWFETQTFVESPMRTVAFGDVDGDGTAEFLSGNFSSVTIREATADNTYGIKFTFTYGSFIERNSMVGDSNGNGKLEFLIPRETSPSRVYILEGTSDDTYSNLGFVTGTQPNVGVAGTADLDGDGLMELVFQENPAAAGGPMGTHIYENGVLVFSILGFAAETLGDTDGNGLIEIIGRTLPGTVDDLRAFESDGDNSYQEVWSDPQHYDAADLDMDGRTELYRITTDGSGNSNVLTIYLQSAGTVSEIWNSGTLFQGSSNSITSVLGIGDTDGNGATEVAVLQGQLLHILELDTAAGLPAASRWSLMLMGIVLVVGVIVAIGRVRRGFAKP